MDKQELLNNMHSGRNELEAALARAKNHMEQPALGGGWSVKDLIAHFSFWERRAATVLRTLQAGRTPSRLGDMDEVNAEVFTQNHLRLLDDIRQDEADAYQDLKELVESSPEADLFDPQRFAWTQGGAIYELVEGDTYRHYQEHLPDLHAWLDKSERA